MHINELRDKAAQLIARQEEILERAHVDGNPALTGEDAGEFDRIEDELRGVEKALDAAEKVEARKRTVAERTARTTSVTPAAIESDEEEDREAAYEKVWRRWLRFGTEGLDADERQVLRTAGIPQDKEMRAQTVTTTGGGYLIPRGFSNELTEALKAFGGVREVARILNTPTGNTIDWPTFDDTGNTGRLLAINTAVTTTDFVYGTVALNAYKYSSDQILVPLELAQDSFFDTDSLVRDALVTRIGRITNTHFTTGDNTAKPQGVTVAAAAGATSAAAAAVSYDDLVDLEHSVDPSYRRNGAWMFKDSTLKLLKKLKDSTGQPIWNAGMAGGAPATILDYRYVINQDMAAATTGLISVLFGDFSYYVVRDVLDFTLVRMDERYADLAQIGFVGLSRHDGRAVVAESAGGPIKKLTQA